MPSIPPAPWRSVHRAADAHREAMRRHVLRAVRKAQVKVNEDALAEALQHGVHSALIALLPALAAYEYWMAVGCADILFDTLCDGADAALGRKRNTLVTAAGKKKRVSRTIEPSFAFDKTNPAAREWASKESAQLVVEVTTRTRDAIRKTVTRAFDERVPPRDLAKLVRPLVGLTEYQSDLVMNKRLKDEAKFGLDRARELAAKYADKLHRQRALTIARTETLHASNEGQRQLWNQAVSKNILTGRERKTWITTPDDRICDMCVQMEGQTVAMNATFSLPDGGQVDGPPAHPNCRCAQGLTSVAK